MVLIIQWWQEQQHQPWDDDEPGNPYYPFDDQPQSNEDEDPPEWHKPKNVQQWCCETMMWHAKINGLSVDFLE